jgi:CubicO group peptidase (beta-lactamase class C family)
MLKRSAFIVATTAAALTAGRGEAAVHPVRFPTHSRMWGGGVRTDTVTYQSYINATTAEYETSFGQLSSQGYVLISLDIYGDVGNELYAAVWVQRPSLSWVSGNDLTFAGLVNFVNTWGPQGFVPTIFAVTGDASNQTCAVVMQQTDNYFYCYFGLTDGSPSTPGTFQYADALFRSQNYDLATVAVYGNSGAPLYLAAWVGNGTATSWADSPADTSTSLTTTIANEKSAGFRPSLVARNAFGVYASVYRGDNVGTWVQRHELSTTAYETMYTAQTAKGNYPISLRAGGPTSQPIFAAVFAKTDLPIPPKRTLTITGTAVSAYAAIEAAIKSFMKTNSVRAGQLTVAQNGTIQYKRAFTWAEAGYPITEPSSLFRLASCSKAFVEAAVQTLYDEGVLQTDTLVFPTLVFSNPGDPRSDTITVQELLDHMGGYDDTIVPDPVFSMRQIALDLGLSAPITPKQFVQWVYSQPLQYTPGTKTVYSNTGYAILSYLIEFVSGMPFINFVESKVMQPLRVTTGIAMTRTAQNLRLTGEVFYDDDEVGLSALTVTSPVLAPDAYGGDGLLYEVAKGASSIATSATVVTKLIHTWLVWGNGPRYAPGDWYLQRDGSMPGTTSVAGSRGNDGFDFCFIFNTRNWPLGSSPSPPDDLANTINSLLDEFDSPDQRFTGQRGPQPLPDRGETLVRRRRAQRFPLGTMPRR